MAFGAYVASIISLSEAFSITLRSTAAVVGYLFFKNRIEQKTTATLVSETGCTKNESSKLEDENLQTTEINSVTQVNKTIPNLALKKAVSDMRKEIASKIVERFEEILKLIYNSIKLNLNKELRQSSIDARLESLAKEINIIWTRYNIQLKKSGVSISREKIHEVIDEFNGIPLLQKVKDFLPSV